MYKDILLPVDIVRDRSRKSLDIAVEYCQAFGSTLHVMTVVPDSGLAMVNQYFNKDTSNEVIDSANEQLHDFVKQNVPDDISVQHIVTLGNVYESIITTARKINADLIVMSAHRPELKDYLLGPNAARVVRHSDKSVLVVRD